MSDELEELENEIPEEPETEPVEPESEVSDPVDPEEHSDYDPEEPEQETVEDEEDDSIRPISVEDARKLTDRNVGVNKLIRYINDMITMAASKGNSEIKVGLKEYSSDIRVQVVDSFNEAGYRVRQLGDNDNPLLHLSWI